MRWVMVDLETTGLHPGHHEIIEAGFVTSWGQEASFSLSFDEEKAEPEALEINGWGKREFAPFMLSGDAGRLVQGLFAQEQTYIVAWPATFDVAFLNEWFRRMGQDSPWHYRNVIDVRSFASAIYGPGCDLSDEQVKARFDIDRANYLPEHGALPDAQFQAEVWNHILNEAVDLRDLA